MPVTLKVIQRTLIKALKESFLKDDYDLSYDAEPPYSMDKRYTRKSVVGNTVRPSLLPSFRPSLLPSFRPFVLPSVRPSVHPSVRSTVLRDLFMRPSVILWRHIYIH